MANNLNQYGLSRTIPSSVKRQVRQECGNGCVLCGKMPYEYDHFDPEFSEATDHDAARIALLCPTHHGEKTHGRLNVDEIRLARGAPHNADRDARWDAQLGRTGVWTLAAGGSTVPGALGGSAVGISLNGEKLFELRRDSNEDWLLSGAFCDEDGRWALKIVDNEAVFSRGVWDVTLEGTELTVRRGLRDIVVKISLVGATRTASLRRLCMRLANGFSVEGSDRAITVTGPGGYTSTVGGNVVTVAPGVTPPRQIIVLGPATDADLTFAINHRGFGTWNDWIAAPPPPQGTRFEVCHFRGRPIDLDENEFLNCTFDSCELVYRGGTPPNLVGNRVDNPRFRFAGQANNVLVFLRAMQHGGFQKVVDQTIEDIRAARPD